MSIGFRTPEIDDLGLAGYVRIVPSDDSGFYDGVLFVINCVGEPVEFCFSRVETPRTVLWGKAALRRRVAAELAKALLGACSSAPILLLARADEVGPETFGEDAVAAVPVCRITTKLEAITLGVRDKEEGLQGSDEIQLVWSGEAPASDAPVRGLLARLTETGMLLEPFERATAGLDEVKRGEADTP